MSSAVLSVTSIIDKMGWDDRSQRRTNCEFDALWVFVFVLAPVSAGTEAKAATPKQIPMPCGYTHL